MPWILNVRNGTKDINTDSLGITKIVRKFYANKFNNLDEMDKIFEKYKLLKLTKEEIENFNNLCQ